MNYTIYKYIIFYQFCFNKNVANDSVLVSDEQLSPVSISLLLFDMSLEQLRLDNTSSILNKRCPTELSITYPNKSTRGPRGLNGHLTTNCHTTMEIVMQSCNNIMPE